MPRTRSSPATTSLAALWPVLGDRSRLRLLALLLGDELSVAELQQVLRLSQPTISNHLGILRGAHLVHSRREGQRIYYALHPELSTSTQQLFQAALLTLDESGDRLKDQSALAEILDKRRQEAQAYFNRIAGRLGKAHCPGRTWSSIGPLLAQLIPSSAVIADLGAGEGWLSLLLAQRAAQVIAIDHSQKMVEFATSELKSKGIANLEYRLGDLTNPPIEPASIDLAIMSQALHHTPNPSQAIRAAFQLLKKGGQLVILDLHHHHFDQARDTFGDYWLGFSETDLRLWCKRAGFSQINFQLLEPDAEPPKLQSILLGAIKPLKS
jgi:ubiquinone/menaquinone biosynthesis C-methylase UbiE